MEKENVKNFCWGLVVFIAAFFFLNHYYANHPYLFEEMQAGAANAKAYWCKHTSGYYELKYESDASDEVDARNADQGNTLSYLGTCEIDTADQSTETSTTFAICHEVSTGNYTQVFEEYTGYAKSFYCKEGNDTKLEDIYDVADKIAEDADSYAGVCTGDTDTTVYCRYKDSLWTTKYDTASNAAQDIEDYPGSHYGGCTYHEWHMDSFGNDYWGYCTSDLDSADLDSDPYKSYSPDAPNARTAGEKKLGVGTGSGATGHKSYKPRVP